MKKLLLVPLFLGATMAAPHAQQPPPPDAAAVLAAAEAAGVGACAACHGMNGISVADGIPNLAAQNAPYLVNQLRAFRSGTRPNDTMQALAQQLDDEQITALAAYYSQQPGAAVAARSDLLPHMVRADFPFPSDFETSFTRYASINFPAPRNQVRHYWANDVALEAAKAGQPLPDGSYILVEIYPATLDANGQPTMGPDGFFVTGERSGFTAMARQPGWGDAIPELLRNENWNYAVFRADGTLNAGANQAGCLACHVPLGSDVSFLFTLEQLSAAR